jgi:hypothetical protein
MRKASTGAKKEQGLETKQAKLHADTIESSVNEMMLILTKAGVTSHGEFFDEFFSIGAAMEAARVDDDSAFELLGCDIANMGLNALRFVEHFSGIDDCQAKWLVFILKHGGSVPIDDLSAWSIDKLLGFLRQHKVDPQPQASLSWLMWQLSSISFV